MNIKVHIFLTFALLSIFSHSQVGINTENPAPSSLLDVVSNEKGILIPRLTSLERDRIDKPSNGLLIYDKENQCLSQNIGNDITPEWVCLGITTRFFYMPSMVIDTTNVGTTKEIDLFSIYKDQFENPMVKSENAKSSIPYFSNAQKLYYYITYYDNSVIDQITIDENGLMKYLVKGTPSEVSFMNVVFVVK